MARLPRDRIVEALLERHGQTYAAELGIDLERNTSSALYRWLCGADIFCHEVQIAWDELFPFADQRALDAAGRLGLADDAEKLAARVARKDFPRLLAARVRTRLANDSDSVLEAASGCVPLETWRA